MSVATYMMNIYKDFQINMSHDTVESGIISLFGKEKKFTNVKIVYYHLLLWFKLSRNAFLEAKKLTNARFPLSSCSLKLDSTVAI